MATDNYIKRKRTKAIGVKVPSWANDKDKVAKWQDYVNAEELKKGNKVINFGNANKNKGIYGNQSKAKYVKYGEMPVTNTTIQNTPSLNANTPPNIVDNRQPSLNWQTNSTLPQYMPKRKVVNPDGSVEITGNIGQATTAYKIGTDNRTVKSPKPKNEAPESKTENGIMKALPLATNMVNLFKKAPLPPAVHLDSPLTLERVNMNNDRAMVERGIRGVNLNADATLDGNSANAVKSYNLAQRFNQLSSVNQAERNQNNAIANEENKLNADIGIGNNRKLDGFERDKVELQIADNRFRQANLASAVDKTVGMYNQSELAKKDARDASIYMAGDKDGVAGRVVDEVKKSNDYDIIDPRYAVLNKKKYGGRLSTGNMMRKLKPIN